MQHDQQHCPLFSFQPQTASPHDLSYTPITPMAPNTTPTKRAKICTMRAAGYSNDEIRAALTGCHDLSDRQIYQIVKRYTEKENYYEVMPRTGHPHKLTPRDTRVALRHLSNTTAHDASDLQHEYFLDVSIQTIRHTLRAEGLQAHIHHTVPFISHKNLHVQKTWAEENLKWTVSNWRAVNFSDESIFCVFGSDGIEWCWRKPGEQLDPQFTKKKVKHSGGKVTVWGMITAQGVGHIVRIEGNLNKEL